MGKFDTLIMVLLFTIGIGLITNGLAVTSSEEEVDSKKIIMLVIGGFGILVVVLLILWKIGRHKYFLHEQHSKE